MLTRALSRYPHERFGRWRRSPAHSARRSPTAITPVSLPRVRPTPPRRAAAPHAMAGGGDPGSRARRRDLAPDPGRGRARLPRSPRKRPTACSPCCRSRTWVRRRTNTSPTGSPRRSPAASQPLWPSGDQPHQRGAVPRPPQDAQGDRRGAGRRIRARGQRALGAGGQRARAASGSRRSSSRPPTTAISGPMPTKSSSPRSFGSSPRSPSGSPRRWTWRCARPSSRPLARAGTRDSRGLRLLPARQRVRGPQLLPQQYRGGGGSLPEGGRPRLGLRPGAGAAGPGALRHVLVLYDRTPARLASAKAAVDRRAPARARAARGQDRARLLLLLGAGGLRPRADEFERALEQQPSNSELLAAIAYVERRRGQWDQAHWPD